MSTMPVVWCSDPNSANKPTAFNLQGIQLQGNISEKHVLAVKELINAASEGRLVLPADGAIVLLDCGIGLGSMIIGDNNKNKLIYTNNNNSISNETSGYNSNQHQYHHRQQHVRNNNSKNADDAIQAAAAHHHNRIINNSRNNQVTSSSSSITPLKNILITKALVHNPVLETGIASQLPSITSTAASSNTNDVKTALISASPSSSSSSIPIINNSNNNDEHRSMTTSTSSPSIVRRISSTSVAQLRSASSKSSSSSSSSQSSELSISNDKPPENNVVQNNDNDILYEFLCCAKCMNDANNMKCSNFSHNKNIANNNKKLIARYLNTKIKSRLNFDPVYNISNRHSKRFLNSKILKNKEFKKLLVKKNSFLNDKQKFIRKNINSFQCIETSSPSPTPLLVDDTTTATTPVYATVNKNLKSSKLLDNIVELNNSSFSASQQNLDESNSNKENIDSLDDAVAIAAAVNAAASRKTSFDSTCTVSSMDSGFIEMQNRLENSNNLQPKTATTATSSPATTTPLSEKNIKIVVSEEMENPIVTTTAPSQIQSQENTRNDCQLKTYLNINKECLPQSKSRRKSYEEFKSLFKQTTTSSVLSPSSSSATSTTNNINYGCTISNTSTKLNCTNKLEIVDEKEKEVNNNNSDNDNNCNENIKSRRKSYEEFKKLVKNCDNIDVSELNNNNLISNSSTTITNINKFKRKNSKRLSLNRDKFKNILLNNNQQKSDVNGNNSKIIDNDIVKQKDDIYKNNQKIYDKLISYGTIYDIIQRKTDIYNKAYRKYDKYMTYGTIYEILHRKSDNNSEGDGFQRKRALSEKFYKRNSVGCGIPTSGSNTTKALNDDNSLNGSGEIISKNFNYSSLKFGTIYDIIQGKQIDNVQRNNEGSKTLSTIYDIILTKKLETANMANTSNASQNVTGGVNNSKQLKNRFLVKKITEEDLLHDKKNDVNLQPNATISSSGIPSSSGSDVGNKHVVAGEYTVAKPTTNVIQNKKQRRFSNILSYTTKITSHNNNEIKLNIPRIKKIAASDEDIYKSTKTVAVMPATTETLTTAITMANITTKTDNDASIKLLNTKIEDLYSRINKMTNDNNNHNNINNLQQLHKSSSLDMLSAAVVHKDCKKLTSKYDKQYKQHQLIDNNLNNNNKTSSVKDINAIVSSSSLSSVDNKKLSPTLMPKKCNTQKRNTRRLSEFTRGEFLNEKQ